MDKGCRKNPNSRVRLLLVFLPMSVKQECYKTFADFYLIFLTVSEELPM